MATVFRITAMVPMPEGVVERIEALRLAAGAAEALAKHLPAGATIEAVMVSQRGKRAAAPVSPEAAS